MSSLFSDEELSDVVGLVLQVFDALQTHHDNAVTESVDGRFIIHYLASLRSLEVALLNVLQHFKASYC